MQKQFVLACTMVFSGFLAQAQAPSVISTTPPTQPSTKVVPAGGTVTGSQVKTKTKSTTSSKTVTKNNDGSKTVQITKTNDQGAAVKHTTKNVSKNNDGSRTVQVTKANGQGTVTKQATKIKPPKTKKTQPKASRVQDGPGKQ